MQEDVFLSSDCEAGSQFKQLYFYYCIIGIEIPSNIHHSPKCHNGADTEENGTYALLAARPLTAWYCCLLQPEGRKCQTMIAFCMEAFCVVWPMGN